jgi:hypothetical protein
MLKHVKTVDCEFETRSILYILGKKECVLLSVADLDPNPYPNPKICLMNPISNSNPKNIFLK